ATTLESQMVHIIQELFGQTLRLQHYCLPRHNLCHRAGAGSQQRWSSFRHWPYLGFCCWRLMGTLQVQTVSLAQTALRLHPRRRAICAALRPAAPEFFEQCYVFRIPTHGRCYTPTANYRLVDTRVARSINPGVALTGLPPAANLVSGTPDVNRDT